MSKSSWCLFLLFIVLFSLLSVGIYFAKSHVSKTNVLELKWTRHVGLQKCIVPEHEDQYITSSSVVSIACRWIWVGLRSISGFNSTPEWPNISDLDSSYRTVFRSEIYQATLKPLSFPKTKWYYVGSTFTDYELFLRALNNTEISPRVQATFGQVEKVVR
jgi:hypothetical protein